ncbi:MAG: nickel-responsive transcriptional regulator NikR [Polyangiales bacterium]
MSELVRFGVAIEDDLLAAFDQQLAAKGYGNRSEAIRDLIRAGLVEETVMRGGTVSGALMLVYKHHVRELSEKLTEIQHALGEAVISALHVHLDHDHCLEVVVMRGAALVLKEASDRILATRGVVHGKLTLTSVPAAATRHAHADSPAESRGRARASSHGHSHAPAAAAPRKRRAAR